jgi:outer membrane protein OmpA-like peptidoglycan-associated protein
MLELQRQAGNRAVTGLLKSRPLQRFVGHEHESLGNVTGVSVDLGNGIVLTWGQVVAIAGDEFATVEDLQAAARTEDGRRRIRAALEHDGVRGPIPATLPAATEADRQAQGAEFIKLAMDNVAHFAEGGDALATWRSHHSRALHEAMEAGLTGDPSRFQQAQLVEAFGQHFLTDMFSGGHVRVPRREIMAYYADRSTAMATAFVTNLRSRVEAALVAQVMLQIPPPLRGNFTQRKAQEKVHAAVGAKIDEGLAKIGGMPGLARYFGLAIAGAVSGALHDREGRQGVIVNSIAHPQPWLAKGDAMLDASPVSREQAESAVLAAREQLLAARHAGEAEERAERLAPSDPPSVVHFAFESAALTPAAAAAAAGAGVYLHVHPTSHVELVGHTDPLGTDTYNTDLGQRRAGAVRTAVIAGGGRAEQVEASSQGEAAVLTRDPRRFSENRRVEFIWQSRPAASEPSQDQSVDPRRERALETVTALGPPFEAVEQYVPRPLEEMNEPLPEWRWGQMAPELVADLDTWIKDMVGPHTDKLISAVPETVTEGDYTLAPRQIVQGIVGQLMNAPSRTIGELIGEPPGKR